MGDRITLGIGSLLTMNQMCLSALQGDGEQSVLRSICYLRLQ